MAVKLMRACSAEFLSEEMVTVGWQAAYVWGQGMVDRNDIRSQSKLGPLFASSRLSLSCVNVIFGERVKWVLLRAALCCAVLCCAVMHL